MERFIKGGVSFESKPVNVENDTLYFAGMETARRDWTALAKELQVDLFTLLFKKGNTPDLKDELCDMVRSRHKQLYDEKLDDKLVYFPFLYIITPETFLFTGIKQASTRHRCVSWCRPAEFRCGRPDSIYRE
jgi:hypothetical protein